MNKRQRGIALIEALIASVILAIGLIGAVGLQVRAQSALIQADQRAEAAIAGEKLLGIMSNDQGTDQANLLLYAKTESAAPPERLVAWHKETLDQMPGAKVQIAVTLDSPGLTRVDLTITWIRKKDDKPDLHRLTTYIAAS